MSYLLLALLASLPVLLSENASAEEKPAPAGAARANISVNAMLEAEVAGAEVPASPEDAVLRALQASSGIPAPAAARQSPAQDTAVSAVPKSAVVGEEPLSATPLSSGKVIATVPPVDAVADDEAGRHESASASPPSAPAPTSAAVIEPTADRVAILPPAPPVASSVSRPAVLPVAQGEDADAGYRAAPPMAAAPQPADAQVSKRSNEVEVSDTDYNRFVFPSPAVQIVSPVGPPVVSEPLYMDGNRTALIRFSPYRWPIQLVFELEDGSVHEVLAKPAPIRGVTKRVGGEDRRRLEAARTVSNAATEAAQAASGFAAAGDVELLENFVLGNVPGNFEEWEELPPEVHFERFWAKPINVWTDGGTTRVEAWRLIGRPGLAASIAPPQFYRPGVRAVQLEHDIVDGRTHPLMLIVLEDFQE